MTDEKRSQDLKDLKDEKNKFDLLVSDIPAKENKLLPKIEWTIELQRLLENDMAPIFGEVHAEFENQEIRKALCIPDMKIPLSTILKSYCIIFTLVTVDTESYTENGAEEVVSYIFYQEVDLKCIPLMLAQVLHEATHGIRMVILNTYYVERLSSDKNCDLSKCGYKPATPPIKAIDGVYKLDGKSQFHSGYLIEHRRRGGIIVKSYGKHIMADGKIVDVKRTDPYFFLIKRIKYSVTWIPSTASTNAVPIWLDEIYARQFIENQFSDWNIYFQQGNRATRQR